MTDQRVQEQVDVVQHCLKQHRLNWVGGTGWLARSQAEIALGRLAIWAEAGLAAAPATTLNEPEGVDERSSPGSSSDAPGAATRLAPASPGSLSAAAAAVPNEAEQGQ